VWALREREREEGRPGRRGSGLCSCPYSPKCLEVEFPEVRAATALQRSKLL
jgi:hypothetical protein